MKPNPKSILESIYYAEPQRSSDCEACQEKLYAYVDAELEGIDAATRFTHIAQHLVTCASCRQEYEELRGFLAMEREGALVEPSGDPQFDWSFLREIQSTGSPAPDPTWYEKSVAWGRAWFERGTDELRRLWLSIPDLGIADQTAPALAGLMGEEEGTTAPLATLHIAPEGANLEVELSVLPDPGDQRLCQVQVAVMLFDRPGDFSGVPVTLLWDSTAYTETTDAQGEVTFVNLPLDRLASMRLQVEMPDQG